MDEMTWEESLAVVKANRLGHLGLADGGDAYVVPLFYGFDGQCFFFHTRPGEKLDYARHTRQACLTITHAASVDEWVSVMAFGHLEEVTLTRDQFRAMEALLTVPLPPSWGESQFGEPRRASAGITLLKLTPTRITGRKSEHRPLTQEERAMAYGGI
ncbi:MAG TPA: pyridoxamine 5'-phosphate oxidase family protein [Candidatus Thermoplasmatota archaeon]|nr:pyridoxamine 5'-phosphate oxidase family protein [Candidatus Thermoplasmatota archaeon]